MHESPDESTQGHDGVGAGPAAAPARPDPPAVTLLVYSDDPATRDAVRLAVGRRPASDLGRVEYVECLTSDDVVQTVDAGGIDLVVLDGEAAPAGGLGVCRQLKDEVRDCPPVLVVTGRRDDRWLATWSRADAAVPHPIDALELVDTVVALLRSVTGRRVVS